MLASLCYIGIVVSIIETWGIEKSASSIQAYFASWTLGSLLGPLITNNFVKIIADSKICGNENATNTIHVLKTPMVAGVFWPYLIVSVIWILSGSSLLLISHMNLKENISEKHKSNTTEIEKPVEKWTSKKFFRYDLWFLILIFSLVSFIVAAGEILPDFIYTIKICMYNSDPDKSALLLTIIWLCMAIGRLLGIILSKYVKPGVLLYCNSSIITLISLLLFLAIHFNASELELFF